MKIQLSDHFNYKKILRFTIPSIAMMILVSLYNIVDVLFVSNVVGKTAFSAVNIAAPVIYIVSSIGHLAGSGGSAIISRKLGGTRERKQTGILLCLSCLLLWWHFF